MIIIFRGIYPDQIVGLRSLRSMFRLLHFIVRSFHSFSLKLDVIRAFLASWLKERGVHTSNALDSARGSKTREKFWLHCGTIWLISLNLFFGICFPLNKGDTPKNLCQQFYKKDCIDYLNAVGKKITLPYVSFLRFALIQKHVCVLVLYVCLLVGLLFLITLTFSVNPAWVRSQTSGNYRVRTHLESP